MDREWVREHLPDTPPEGLVTWTLKTQQEDLGGEYIIFKSERVKMAPPLEMMMDNQLKGKTVWAVRCSCSNCQEEWITQKTPGAHAFRMYEGDDGELYSVEPDDSYVPGTMIEIADGDRMNCPYCGKKARAIHADKIRGGRTKRIRVCCLENIGRYTAVIYWLISREIDETGISCVDAEPEKAFVITEKGGIVPFTKRHPGFMGKTVPASCWYATGSRVDAWDQRYSDWGSINNTKVGATIYKEQLPNMDGTTGEKTGLLTWFREDRSYPVEYLKYWQWRHGLETIVVAGLGDMVQGAMFHSYNPKWELAQSIDFTKKKPHQMLGISKEAFRVIVNDDGIRAEDITMWRRYRAMNGRMKDREFFAMLDSVGGYILNSALGLMAKYGDEPDKVFRYLEKQRLRPNSINFLVDARRFSEELQPNEPLTAEQMWPRRLQEFHDRIHRVHLLKIDEERAKSLQSGFDAVRQELAPTEWRSGDLCIMIPKSNNELVAEGKTLCHCVGGYGTQHSKGTSVIFFVRHWKRPERSYYTLNISFAGSIPERVQLHGYGNERHGDKKQYVHKIPDSVLNFVDEWEQKVLKPFWVKKMKQEAKTA